MIMYIVGWGGERGEIPRGDVVHSLGDSEGNPLL